jgi:hypothetical protein
VIRQIERLLKVRFLSFQSKHHKIFSKRDRDEPSPIFPDEYWELRAATSATLREKLASLPEETVLKVRQEVREAAARFFPKGHMNFPAQIIIVAARKP